MSFFMMLFQYVFPAVPFIISICLFVWRCVYDKNWMRNTFGRLPFFADHFAWVDKSISNPEFRNDFYWSTAITTSVCFVATLGLTLLAYRIIFDEGNYGYHTILIIGATLLVVITFAAAFAVTFGITGSSIFWVANEMFNKL